MIDLHSHILPGIDDGSRDAAESVALWQMLAEQGVTAVAATPHFYANRRSVDEFLAGRQDAYERMHGEYFDTAPKVLLGAEVRYYEGISRMSGLQSLCIEGSNLLLLEMPEVRWSEYTVRELIQLSSSGSLTVVLAHIERSLYQQTPQVREYLREYGILTQVNATFFTGLGSRRKAFRLLREGRVQFLGSDCHSVQGRPPYIGQAMALIEKKMGREFIQEMTDYQASLLGIG